MKEWLMEYLPTWMFDPNITAPIAMAAGVLGLVLGFAYSRYKNGRKDQ